MQPPRPTIDDDVGGHGPPVRAHLHDHVLPAPAVGLGEQNQPVGVERRAPQQLLGTDDDLIGGRARFNDVAGTTIGRGAGEPQAPALAHREAEVALMRAQDLAVGGDQRPLAHAQRTGEEAASVAVGHEADVVGVGLGGHRQAAIRRLGAHGRLGGGLAQREQGAGQALPAGDGQDVGLVLGGVGGAPQGQALGPAGTARGGAAGQARVVAGGHGVEPQGQGPGEEGVELDALIAAHAGIGGAPGPVLGQEVGHDALLELLGQVPHVEGDAQDLGGPAGVGGVLDGAAPARAAARGGALAGQGHVHGDDVVPGLHGTRGRDGGIDSARQCRQDAHNPPFRPTARCGGRAPRSLARRRGGR